MEKIIYIEGQPTNYSVKDGGTIWNLKLNKEVKGTTARNEYLSVQLTINGKRKSIMAHRLVAEYFCENPHNYNIVHHKDGNCYNNRAENLEWVSTKENNQSYNKKAPRAPKKREKIEDLSSFIPLPFNTNYGINKEGIIVNFLNHLQLTGNTRNGYKRITYDNHVYSIHRLVYETFVGKIPKGMVVDHIDGNRANNALTNLRLITQSENMFHAMEQGHKCQTPVLQFDKEGNLLNEYKNITEAARFTSVSREAITQAVNGRIKIAGGFLWKKKKE